MKRLLIILVLMMGLAGVVSAQSTLPTVTIVTDGPIVNTPAVHGMITVDDHNGTVIEMHAGFKIRGTSSQQYDKKSYRVELWADETGTLMADTTFLGMRSDDDWNLEAMYNQPLRLRNKIANELWREIYTLPYQESEPEAASSVAMEYVDVYVNGEHKGVYTLSERVDRKLLGLRKYNGNLRGVLFKGNGPGNASFEALPDYDNTLDVWDQFEWVYPNESDTAVDWSGLYSFVNFVINSTNNAFYSQYSTMFEESNAIDYYLFINALGAIDNMDRNTFIARYKKTSAYFYVPWDLDGILGNDANGQPTVSEEGLRSNGFFDRLVQDCSSNGFAGNAQERYNSLRDSILTTAHIMEMIRAQYQFLVDCGAYDIEHEVWPEYTVDASELDAIANWLDARFAWLDAEINSACGTWDNDETSVDNRVEVFPNPAKNCINIRFAEAGGATVQVYDMMGRMVYSTVSDAQVLTLPTRSFPGGVYAVVTYQNDKQFVNRIIIE
ncbi:MAG: CotH kinase family protein [Bacteroidales bacterium]|nr:CotH kinase family protein [Bacteroidales bacterium]